LELFDSWKSIFAACGIAIAFYLPRFSGRASNKAQHKTHHSNNAATSLSLYLSLSLSVSVAAVCAELWFWRIAHVCFCLQAPSHTTIISHPFFFSTITSLYTRLAAV
jgi:hypothetical protein